MDIRIAGIEPASVTDGDGFRFVVFTQGCIHECFGCHNPETHDLYGGALTTTENILEVFNKMKNSLTKGITFSGGEPFLQPEACIEIAKEIHKIETEKYPSSGKYCDVWCYTGYTYEQILRDETKKQFLNHIDVLIDGPYIQSLRDINLKFRGSSNQRILYLKNGEIDRIET